MLQITTSEIDCDGQADYCTYIVRKNVIAKAINVHCMPKGAMAVAIDSDHSFRTAASFSELLISLPSKNILVSHNN